MTMQLASSNERKRNFVVKCKFKWQTNASRAFAFQKSNEPSETKWTKELRLRRRSISEMSSKVRPFAPLNWCLLIWRNRLSNSLRFGSFWFDGNGKEKRRIALELFIVFISSHSMRSFRFSRSVNSFCTSAAAIIIIFDNFNISSFFWSLHSKWFSSRFGFPFFFVQCLCLCAAQKRVTSHEKELKCETKTITFFITHIFSFFIFAINFCLFVLSFVCLCGLRSFILNFLFHNSRIVCVVRRNARKKKSSHLKNIQSQQFNENSSFNWWHAAAQTYHKRIGRKRERDLQRKRWKRIIFYSVRIIAFKWCSPHTLWRSNRMKQLDVDDDHLDFFLYNFFFLSFLHLCRLLIFRWILWFLSFVDFIAFISMQFRSRRFLYHLFFSSEESCALLTSTDLLLLFCTDRAMNVNIFAKMQLNKVINWKWWERETPREKPKKKRKSKLL